MKRIQQIFTDHAAAYVAMNRHRMPEVQRRALEAIISCRTPDAGGHVYECPKCGEIHLAHSSCGNRHCPVCQNDKAAHWVYRQQRKGLPCTYFLATFTLPPPLQDLARRYPEKVYQALFEASSHALKKLEADKRFIGCATAGFFGVLHTWGRRMQYHPHIHYVIPGGGLSGDRSQWVAARNGFLVHVRALSSLFRGRFRAQLARHGLLGYAGKEVWRKDWVVHCKAVGDGRKVLKYLGAYVFRVAISNARILAYDGQNVTFRYRKVGCRRERKCTLDAITFMRRFLQHILPKGFVKVRHYGFLHARCSVAIERVRELIALAREDIQAFVVPDPPKAFKPLRCQRCHCVMKWKRFISPWRVVTNGGP